MQIFIGNLSSMTTARHLANLFLPYGEVRSSKIVSDNLTGHSLGFGFIDMEPNCAKKAIHDLNRLLFMNYYVEMNLVG